MDVEKRIKAVMGTIFDIPEEAIDMTASVRTIAAWKGKNHLKMVQALENEFSIQFETGEVETLISYKIIRATVLAYLG